MAVKKNEGYRKTAVRDMVRSGIPEHVAMNVSGHKTRSFFERYNIVSGGCMREAAREKQAYYEEQNDQSERVEENAVRSFRDIRLSCVSKRFVDVNIVRTFNQEFRGLVCLLKERSNRK